MRSTIHTVSLTLLQSILPPRLVAGFDVVEKFAKHGIDVSTHAYEINRTHLSQHNNSIGCVYACRTLSLAFNSSVAYRNTSAYHFEGASYWNQQQADFEPYCFFQPTTPEGVAVAVLLSRLTECPFAVKSGGHAAFAGASNIPSGITVDLANLDSVSVSSNNTIASAGAGNTWYDIYTHLDPRNLTAIGGRVSAIGVGGLTLGDGNSFFSGKYGWACDNVYNYQLVTAEGEIIDVSYNSTYRDLYWALRGGGNNFGIVTRFDLYAYPQGEMWGGTVVYLASEYSDAMLKALVQFSRDAPNDPNAALIVPYAYAAGVFLILADLEYALPTQQPEIFSTFFNTPNISDSTGNKTLSAITQEFNASNPGALRETYWTATFSVDFSLLQYMVSLYENYTTPLLSTYNVTSLEPAFVLQIITTDQISHMSNNGGNALGLAAHPDEPLVLPNLAYWWANEADDKIVISTVKKILDGCIPEAKRRGLGNEYLYINYASQYQDVVPSYNATNWARLKEVAAKYDPTGVFQKLQPGYFKLRGGAPVDTETV